MRKGSHSKAAMRRRIRNRRKQRHNILPNPHDGTDRISDLPNDILISIISRLTVREAKATSVLSSRWRHLHHQLTRLDFPEFKVLGESPFYAKYDVRRFRDHVNMINRVIDSHGGCPTVKELKMHMTRLEGGSIKKWVEFAFTKEIESIDISLCPIPFAWYFDVKSCYYRLGLSRLILAKTSQNQPLRAVKYLKRLTLNMVDLNDQDFDLLVTNFPVLETLCVRHPGNSLRKCSIVGHPKLKHIDLYHGFQLECCEIRGLMNLVYLRCYLISTICALELENLPKLTELHMNERGKFTYLNEELFAKIPCCLRDQLELLSFSSSIWESSQHHMFQPFEFVTIKRLEFEVDTFRSNICYHRFYPLIEACPSLEKAKIKFYWQLYRVQRVLNEFPEKKANNYDPHHKKLSPNLRVLELEGYVGNEAEFELCSYVINYAVNLERVIVVACAATKRIRRKVSQLASLDFQLITPPPLELKIMGWATGSSSSASN